MKRIIIIIICIITIISIVFLRPKPYSVWLSAGLSNRLRTIMGLYHTNKNKNINVYWGIDNACNGHFEEAFQPIENIKFVNILSVIPSNFKGQNTFETIVRKHQNISDNDMIELQKQMYSKLKLKPELQKKVDDFVKLYKIDQGISIHIRRTDFLTDINRKLNISLYNKWYEFINMFPSNTPVYLATDNRDTQDDFISKYPNVIVWKMVEKSSNVRQTTFVDAVIDIFIASKAPYFLGTDKSSYSELIDLLGKI